jgi:ADP-ribose pyrophosphatase YjhB (NUDIX family)
MAGLDGWKHCPRCGADVTPAGGRALCGACGFTAYAHSEPTACALVVDDHGRLLLARRAGEPEQGKWDLPGGFLGEGEPPLDGLRRELREETGLEIEPLAFVGAWVDRYGSSEGAPFTLNLYWTARIVAGEMGAADDVSELRWFTLEELPAGDELAFSNVAEAIRSWRAWGGG